MKIFKILPITLFLSCVSPTDDQENITTPPTSQPSQNPPPLPPSPQPSPCNDKVIFHNEHIITPTICQELYLEKGRPPESQLPSQQINPSK